MLHAESLPYAPGSDTSREAAETGRTNAAKWRARVAAMFAAQDTTKPGHSDSYGYTADELAAWFGVPANTIAPRITALQQDGEIIDTGLRRRTRSGKRAVVWASAPSHDQRRTYVVTFYVHGLCESLRVNALTHTTAIHQAKQLAAAHGIDAGAAKKITAEVAK